MKGERERQTKQESAAQRSLIMLRRLEMARRLVCLILWSEWVSVESFTDMQGWKR